MIALLPSEIARLILNYLEEESLNNTYETFLNECKYLEECKYYLKKGIIVPKTIHGKTLTEYLVINNQTNEKPIKKIPTNSVYIQTDSIVTCSISTECNLDIEDSTSFIENCTNIKSLTNKHDPICLNIQAEVNQTEHSPKFKRKISECADQSDQSELSEKDIILEEIIPGNAKDQNSTSSSIENHSPTNKNIISNFTEKLYQETIPLNNVIRNEIQTPGSASKKRKLLIGKNVEKIPELTVSSIERQLDSFINDAANHLKLQKEQIIDSNEQFLFNLESKKSLSPKHSNQTNITSTQTFQNVAQKQNQKILPKTNNSSLIQPKTANILTQAQIPNLIQPQPQILFDLVTGQATTIQNQLIKTGQIFAPTQPSSVVIIPHHNIETPVVPKVQQLKEPLKNIPPQIIVNQLSNVHLTNALNMVSPTITTTTNPTTVQDTTNTRLNRFKTPLIIPSIKPENATNEKSKLLEAIKQTEFQPAPSKAPPKKKKVYNRVTPTIRAIYEKNDQEKQILENVEKANIQNENENSVDSNTNSRDVHDEISDIFDLPFVKSTGNQQQETRRDKSSDSSDISLDDIIIKTNETTNYKNTANKNKKTNLKSRKSSNNLNNNNRDQESDDEFDLWFSDPKQLNSTANTVTNSANNSTRTLRSRTNSQRKMQM